jgi:hypothetical protein
MSFMNAEPATPHQGPKGWLRLASQALARLADGARPKGAPAPVEPSPAAYQPIIGIRKSAVCKDARGELRVLELFLPADLVAELARPLDIKFLDGDQPVTADQLGKAIRANFSTVRARS